MNKIINKDLNEVINYINFNLKHKPIIIVGMMAAGKSAIGRMLAKSLNRNFFDIDQNIEDRYHIKIYEIFEQYGKSNNIISTGGGAFTFKRNYSILNKIGLTIWLNTNQKTIIKRLKKNINNRPLLKDVDLETYVSSLLIKRSLLYSKANLTIISNNYSKIEMRNKVLLEIKKYLVENNNVKNY
jgi:shikimate kinase